MASRYQAMSGSIHRLPVAVVMEANPKMADKTAPATVIFFPLEDSLRIKLWAVAEASFWPDRL